MVFESQFAQNAFGFSSRPTTTKDDSIAIAEPTTSSVQFPALNSQQRAKNPSSSIPTFEISDSNNTNDDDEDEEDEEGLPNISIDSSSSLGLGLAPPTTTKKVLKVPKGRVRVEKGFSQLDWAKLNRNGGDIDLRGGVTELKRITISEMSQHRTREDCWQSYQGKVYNVGPFLKFHPGGDAEMMRGAGKDATQLFSM
jgi:hypothetical protein